MYAFSGITLYGSLVLPGCLLDVDWQNEDPLLPMNRSLLNALTTKARFDGTVRVDDHDCSRVVCERETVNWVIYVDQETNLIRRADCEITEAQMERLKSRGWGGGASGNLLAISRSQVFAIDDAISDESSIAERKLDK